MSKYTLVLSTIDEVTEIPLEIKWDVFNFNFNSDSSDYSKLHRAMVELERAINMRKACRLMPAITAEELGLKIAMLNTCDIDVAVAQGQLDRLRHRLLTNWTISIRPIDWSDAFQNVN